MTRRHAGFQKQIAGLSESRLRRMIRRLERLIRLHREKVAKSPTSQAALHWQKEIKVWEEQVALAQAEVDRRATTGP